MISRIRNPWIRRPLVLLYVFTLGLFLVALDMLASGLNALCDVVDDARQGWRGR